MLAAEAAGFDAAGGPRLSERQVTFEVHDLTPDLLALRTADDLLLDLGTLYGVDHTKAALGDLPRRLSRLDFGGALACLADVRPLDGPLTFDVVASLLGRRNYNRYAVEDAAAEAVERAVGARYVSRNPASGRSAKQAAATDFTVRLSLNGESVEAALRLPRKPLHRRPWKLDTGPGTLHPPLAAALVQIGGHAAGDPVRAVVDPFCGDGTLAVEAALALPDAYVVAADLDAERLRNAEVNAARAEAGNVAFVRADAGAPSWADNGPFDLLVTNPPWNRAVGAAGSLSRSLEPFWRLMPDLLTPHGRICTIAEADLGVPEQLDAAGYTVALAQTIRLAGRVSHVVLASAPGGARTSLSPALALWRERAVKAGIIDEAGF